MILVMYVVVDRRIHPQFTLLQARRVLGFRERHKRQGTSTTGAVCLEHPQFRGGSLHLPTISCILAYIDEEQWWRLRESEESPPSSSANPDRWSLRKVRVVNNSEYVPLFELVIVV